MDPESVRSTPKLRGEDKDVCFRRLRYGLSFFAPLIRKSAEEQGRPYISNYKINYAINNLRLSESAFKDYLRNTVLNFKNILD